MTYSLTSSQQLTAFFLAMGLGFIFGAVYYAAALLRKMISQSDKAFFVFDIVFGIVCSLLYFVFITVFSNGEIRLDQLFSVFVGFFAFVKVFGKAAEKSSDKISHFFRKSVGLVLLPLKLILKILKKTKNFFKKKAENIRSKRKEKRKQKPIKEKKKKAKPKRRKKVKINEEKIAKN